MRNATAPKTPSFARLVQQFFTEYLVAQRALSPCTVASYRDALMLFLGFAGRTLGKGPSALRLVDIQPDLILTFLDHLERERHNAVRSRNLRLTALRAFLKFAGRRDVSALHVVEQALAVPMKRSDTPMLGYLTREEMLAVLGQPGSDWTSQRDHLLLAMLYNTGARVRPASSWPSWPDSQPACVSPVRCAKLPGRWLRCRLSKHRPKRRCGHYKNLQTMSSGVCVPAIWHAPMPWPPARTC